MKNPDFSAKSGPNPDQFAQKSPDPDQSPEIRTKVGALNNLPNNKMFWKGRIYVDKRLYLAQEWGRI